MRPKNTTASSIPIYSLSAPSFLKRGRESRFSTGMVRRKVTHSRA
jgi:hypothetical protein